MFPLSQAQGLSEVLAFYADPFKMLTSPSSLEVTSRVPSLTALGAQGNLDGSQGPHMY